MKNPVDSYLTEKQASGRFVPAAGLGPETFREGLRGAFNSGSIGKRVGEGAIAAGGAAGVALVGVAAQKLYDAATKAHDFKSMLEQNPDLAEKHEEDPRLFNQMFSTLRTFNPSFTRDPVVAGHYMRQMVEDPMRAGGVATEALNFREKMKSPFGEVLRPRGGGSAQRHK